MIGKYSAVLIEVNVLTSYDAAMRTVKCTNTVHAASIVTMYTGANTQSTNVTCEGYTWVAAICSSSSSSEVGLCINCTNPCSTITTPFLIAPCVSRTSSSSSSFQTLSVAWKNALSVPKIVNVTSVVAESTSVSITLQLSEEALVLYCGVYTSNKAVSISSLVLQNRVARSTGNMTSFTINGLIASTDYQLFFYAQSLLGAEMSQNQVLATALNITTACCRSLTMTLTKKIVLENTQQVGLIALTIDSLPSSSVLTVTVNMQRVTPMVQELLSQVPLFLSQALLVSLHPHRYPQRYQC